MGEHGWTRFDLWLSLDGYLNASGLSGLRMFGEHFQKKKQSGATKNGSNIESYGIITFPW